ncbi:MAG: hypothetical protein WCG27_04375, partial [Pseudomonadota bacterium]
MFFKILILMVTLNLSIVGWAKTEATATATETAKAADNPEYTQKVREEIESIKNLTPEEYVGKIDGLRIS